MYKSLLIYGTGVITAPVWLYIFRKPLIEKCIVPFLADEKFDEGFNNVITTRTNLQKIKREAGE